MKDIILTASLLLVLLAGIEAIEIGDEICALPLTPPEYACPRSAAPRDFSSFCRTGEDFVGHRANFPSNWNILYDSFDYFSILDIDRGKWLTTSLDGNTNKWRGRSGGICERNFYVCTGNRNEENWAFSQQICLKGAKEILVNVSYSFAECSGNSQCDDDFLMLYSTQTDKELTSSQRKDTSNYLPLGGKSVLRQPQGNEGQVTETLRFPRDEPSKSNLYMAMKDTGTCGEISRLILYYRVCNAKQVGLVSYPEFPSPASGSTETFSAVCACNAHPLTSLEVVASSNGQCTDVAAGGARCQCDGGYGVSSNGKACDACPAGTYRLRDDSGTACKRCRANTRTDVSAASSCECLPGFFRDDTPTAIEGPDDPCRAPPSPPVDLKTDRRTDTTLTLSWIPPSNMPDLVFNICTANAFDLSKQSCVVSSGTRNNGRVVFTVSNLDPSSSYSIEVESMNGVSDQDPDNRVKRIADIFESTTEGVPDEPILKKLCTVVIWKPPPTPKGYITSYELCFGTCPTPTDCHNVSSSENFMLTTGLQRDQNVGVYIRASNSQFKGPFTPCDSIGCSELQGCQPGTLATLSTTTPTPVTAPRVEPTQSCIGPELRVNSGLSTRVSGTELDMNRVGVEDEALLCVTMYRNCCKSNKGGEWYRVGDDGSESTLPLRAENEGLYRNRGDRVVRLNIRDAAATTAGLYRCCVPDSCGNTKCIDITLV